MVELQRQVEAPGCGFQRAQAFGHDFLADAVAGDDCNLLGMVSRSCFPARCLCPIF
jgi:hypothetical protein